MKVSELIERLSQMDPDLMVVADCGGDCPGIYEISDEELNLDEIRLDCNPSRGYYGTPHISEAEAQRFLEHSTWPAEAKKEIGEAKRVKCLVIR